jgi:predicted amidohydrolase YtcJ
MKRWAIVNANIITMAAERPRAEALLIEGDCIAAVGARQEILALAAGVETKDLAGATVLPGFIDCHVHAIWTGMAALGADLIGAESIHEILNRLAEYDKKHPGPQWLCGNGYDESFISEGRPPALHELDTVNARRPILVRQRGGHSCVVNTAGFRLLNLPPETKGIARARSGEPTGLLFSDALPLALAGAGAEMEPSLRADAIQRACEIALAKGVTTMHALQKAGPHESGTIELLCRKDWPVRIVVYPTTLDAAWAQSQAFPRVGGCILLDGALEAHTGALFEPYTDAPDQVGQLYLSSRALQKFVRSAHGRGLQICVHAVAERAVQQALDAYALALSGQPRPDHRHRIEHFVLPTDAQIRRAAELGVAVCAQPTFEFLWGGAGRWFEKLIGERWRRTTPLRSMLEASVLVAGGSDSYVSPIDPLLGIHSAVNHPNAEQRISPMDALRLFTHNAARIAFQEREIGVLAPGRLADIVVLAEDPTGVPPGRIKDIRIVMTVVGGEVRHGDKGLLQRGRVSGKGES